MKFSIKKILWIIAGLFIVHTINDFLGISTIGRLLTTVPIAFFLYVVYNIYIPQNWK